MKRLVFAVAALTLAGAFAETAAPVKKPNLGLSKAQRQAKREAFEMKKFGGFLIKPNSASGKIVFVDTRKDAKDGAVDATVAYLRKMYQFPVEAVKGGDAAVADVSKIRKQPATMTIVLCEKDDAPALLLAPEDMWASVNVKALAKGNPEQKVLEARIRKELNRAFSFLAGAGNSQGSATVMTPIFSNMELDERFVEEIPPDVDGKFRNHLAAFGIKPWLRATYKYACEHGWAPQPTNEFQKAVWDAVHEMPTKPLTIEPESKQKK